MLFTLAILILNKTNKSRYIRIDKRLDSIVIVYRSEDPLKNVLTFNQLFKTLVTPQRLRIRFLLFGRLCVVQLLL